MDDRVVQLSIRVDAETMAMWRRAWRRQGAAYGAPSFSAWVRMTLSRQAVADMEDMEVQA